jgi:hypothetical protein
LTASLPSGKTAPNTATYEGGLSREGLDDYLKTKLQGVPVYSNLESSTTEAYRFGGTPETILVANDGTVIKVWKGAYTGETLQDIEKYFRVRLPGLRQSL